MESTSQIFASSVSPSLPSLTALESDTTNSSPKTPDRFSSVPLFSSNSLPFLTPSNQPLPLPLNKWYITDPRAEANCYGWKALGANTLAAITFVAAIALASSIVFFSFLAASGTAMPLGIALGGVAGALSILVSGWLRVKGKEYSARAEKERRIADIHQRLLNEDLNTLNTNTFLRACNIEITEQKINLIQQFLPVERNERAREAYLLVLARFLHACEHANQLKERDYPSPKHDPRKYTTLYPMQREVDYQKYWAAREVGIYPSVLTAILMRDILENPFRQESVLKDLGDTLEKTYTLRHLDRNNAYLIFREEGRVPIDMKDIKPAKKILSSYKGLDADFYEQGEAKSVLDALQERLLPRYPFEEIKV